MATPIRSASVRSTLVAALAMTTIAGGRDAVAQSAPVSDTTKSVVPAVDSSPSETTLIPTRAELSPSTPRIVLATMGIATAEGIGFAILGNNIDYLRCRRDNRGVQGAIFTDPCFGYSGNATKTGWFVGSLGGAAVGALAMARLRGCPFAPGIARSVAGTIIGALPAMITASTPSEKIPAKRSMLIGSAPVLGGLAAALAVSGCHR